MSEQYIQAPANSTGKKLRGWEETIGANTITNQIVESRRGATYSFMQGGITPGASKVYLGILNGSGSGKKVIIHRAFLINVQQSTVTGGEMTARYVKITALSGGTTVAVIASDPASAAVPAQIVCQTASTTSTEASAPAEYFSHRLNTDETTGLTLQAGFPAFFITGMFNPCNPLSTSRQLITLNEGEGLAMKQGSEAIAAGSIMAMIVFELR